MNSRSSESRRHGVRAKLMAGAGITLLAAAGMVGAVAGPASAADVSTSVACVNEDTGEWHARVHFGGLDVRSGGAVVLRWGGVTKTVDTTGDYTLAESFGPDDDAASLDWSIDRNGTIVRAGSASFERPPGCRPVPPSPPTTQPPTTVVPPTPRSGGAGGTPPKVYSAPPLRPAAPPVPQASGEGALPETGGAHTWAALLGAGLAVTGAGLVTLSTRRRSA